MTTRSPLYVQALREAQEAVRENDWPRAAQVLSRLPDHAVPSPRKPELELLRDAARFQPGELKAIVTRWLTSTEKESLLNVNRTTSPRVFLVHGWDSELKWEAKNYLQTVLGLDCVILHEQDGRGGTLIDKFEQYARPSDLAMVLLSSADGSDEGFASPDATRRPRPNVLFEMGYFFAHLGRERVLLLRKGDVEIHSDILGIEYIDVTHGIHSAGEDIRRRLSAWLG
jgi:predicted nucleotide-binding protein